MRVAALILLALPPLPLAAETVVAARTLRAETVVSPSDVRLDAAVVPGALTDPDDAIGMELRTTIYAGRPLRPEHLGPPALVARNQLVELVFRAGGLSIRAEGRALSRGAAGELVRVMNLASRTTVTGMVAADGSVVVGMVAGGRS